MKPSKDRRFSISTDTGFFPLTVTHTHIGLDRNCIEKTIAKNSWLFSHVGLMGHIVLVAVMTSSRSTKGLRFPFRFPSQSWLQQKSYCDHQGFLREEDKDPKI